MSRSFIQKLLVVVLAGVAAWTAHAQTTDSRVELRLVEIQGTVEVMPDGSSAWQPARTNSILHPHDRIRTAGASRASVLWDGESVVSFDSPVEFEVLQPLSASAEHGLHLIRGAISFFHRNKPGAIQMITRGAVAGVEGTEFVMAVDNADTTTLSVIDGKVKVTGADTTLVLTNGEQAVTPVGQPPHRTAGFIANNILQWCFYYPAVLDPADVPFSADEQKTLADSLNAYRSGALLLALDKFPTNGPDSDAAKLYHAALLLSVGDVQGAQNNLASIGDKSERYQRLTAALQQLIRAVKHEDVPPTYNPQLTTEFLANSYYEQSRAVRETSLQSALALAKRAVTVAPDFGFAWERLAELQFCFGRIDAASDALNKSLSLAPRNAQALALKGFLLAAKNFPHAAIDAFDQAIAVDSALGNAWLGRGISRMRVSDTKGGREDLLVAAALEPRRAELRSYLGKAFTTTGDDAHAARELRLAKQLDPNDPTAWLYSALLNQQNNQINDAIRDLEKSQQLNDNRSVYRSQLLLDQDHAVRSVNLASMYNDAGMKDVSLQEAGRAVSYDYANYSAHLFLANSYDNLRDPMWSNLRYETTANSEFWIANLLAPTSAGVLSTMTSEQNYSHLFEQNRFGVVSDTTYLSRGAWTEGGSQYGIYDNVSYNVDAKYSYDPGQRQNNDREQRDLNFTIKDQVTPHDSVFFSAELDRINNGNTSQYYNEYNTNLPIYRVNEKQEPNLFFGYHHEWNPGVHTVFLGARLTFDEPINATGVGQIQAYNWDGFMGNNGYQGGVNFTVDEYYNISPEIYSAELQQIWEQPEHTTVIGSRYQWGSIDYSIHQSSPDFLAVLNFPDPNNLITTNFSSDFHRLTLYGYHSWQVLDAVTIIGGLSYDYEHLPYDVTTPPFSKQERNVVQFSPKIGIVWNPLEKTIIRAAYTRSLSGALNDQSIRIEPTEVAGFNQAFRSIAPESAAGTMNGAEFETYDVSIEQKLDTGTYLSLAGEILYSKDQQLAGSWVYDWNTGSDTPDGIKQSLYYRERSLIFTADQLLGKQWSAGTRYRISQATLDDSYPQLPPAGDVPPFRSHMGLESVLHQINLHANWNHPSGFFSSLEGNWYHQSNSGFSPAEPGDDFWQFNAYGGYRFWHRKAELTLGLLNITDQNYSLEPLNLYNEMARSRTLLARLRINF